MEKQKGLVKLPPQSCFYEALLHNKLVSPRNASDLSVAGVVEPAGVQIRTG
jgi:hypothetical protein